MCKSTALYCVREGERGWGKEEERGKGRGEGIEEKKSKGEERERGGEGREGEENKRHIAPHPKLLPPVRSQLAWFSPLSNTLIMNLRGRSPCDSVAPPKPHF